MSIALCSILIAGTLHGPPVVHGGERAPQAWAALVRGQAWVCWVQAPGCWHRLPMDSMERPRDSGPPLDEDLETHDDPDAELTRPPTGPAEIRRLGFLDARRVVLVDGRGDAWQVDRGDAVLRPVDPELGLVARVPRAMPCGPTGVVPDFDGLAWTWAAVRCSPAGHCRRRGLGLGPARPVGLAVTVGIEVAVEQGATQVRMVNAASGRASAAMLVLATVSLAFDARAATAHRRRWRTLARLAEAEVDLPAVPAGPLASRERTAMHSAVCRKGEP